MARKGVVPRKWMELGAGSEDHPLSETPEAYAKRRTMLTQALAFLANKVLGFLRNEAGADAIEYLLTIAVIAVAVVVGVATGLPGVWLGGIINGVCTAINTTFPNMAMACP